MKLSNLIELYSDITKECSINNVGEIFSYYYADNSKTAMSSLDVIELDISSAFPTICKIIFGKDHEFVNQIYQMSNKLERNIFIATTLKEQSTDNNNYLQLLNIYSKIICLGKIYNEYENVNILEYKKDGAIFTANRKNKLDNNEFSNFLDLNEIDFHINEIDVYLRFNNTSIYKYSNDVIVKGKYKSPPQYIQENLLNIFKNPFKTNEFENIYSDRMFKILKISKLFDLVKYYYMFENKYITLENTFSNNISDCYPKQILRNFLFPVLLLLRKS